MAMTIVGDLNIEYYEEGSGPPLLLIMGLGGQASSWGEPLLEQLQAHFSTVRFSNRGTGATDKTGAGYTILQIADDAAGLIQALGVAPAPVFCISMLGMIAPEIVFQ